LRTGGYDRYDRDYHLRKLAELYEEVGQREKAIATLKKVLSLKNSPDVNILNKLGHLYGDTGNLKAQERMYREAGKVSWCGTPMFNLALAQRDRGHTNDALKSVETALEKKQSAPYKVLKGMLLQKGGRQAEAKEALKEAMAGFDSIQVQDEWELGWYQTAAKMLDQDKKASEAERELKKRKKEKTRVRSNDSVQDGLLPILLREAESEETNSAAA
ncbi:tetratricopeptide repeat protein, partial [Fibrobacterota bacterium]